MSASAGSAPAASLKLASPGPATPSPSLASAGSAPAASLKHLERDQGGHDRVAHPRGLPPRPH